MKQSESIAKLSAALVKAQDHITPIAKDRVNSHFKNSYATLDAIMESVRGPLAGVGLAIVQGGGAPVSNVNGDVVAVGVETMLIHESGEFVSSVITLPIAQASPQAVGSAVTYGRRYGVAALLALTTEEDDDGNHAQATVQHAAPKVTAPARVLDRAGVEKALDMAPVEENTDCPKCGGPTWDNRATKKNPKAPNFKCRDKACDGVIWPPKDVPAPQPAMAGHDAPPPLDDDDMPPF